MGITGAARTGAGVAALIEAVEVAEGRAVEVAVGSAIKDIATKPASIPTNQLSRAPGGAEEYCDVSAQL
jgi:hypothetical protein